MIDPVAPFPHHRSLWPGPPNRPRPIISSVRGNRGRFQASKVTDMETALQAEQSTGIDDATLVRQVQAGDGGAFAHLIRRYQDRIYNACWRICGRNDVAQDLTQDTFLKAYASIGSFQCKSGFYTWLFRIAINLSLSHRRRAKLRVVTSLDDASGKPEAGAAPSPRQMADPKAVDPADAAIQKDMRRHVAAALQSIDEHHRVVLVLRDIEGLDYARIADVLDVPVGTVKSRVFRARNALREVLERMVRTRTTQSGETNDSRQSKRIG